MSQGEQDGCSAGGPQHKIVSKMTVTINKLCFGETGIDNFEQHIKRIVDTEVDKRHRIHLNSVDYRLEGCLCGIQAVKKELERVLAKHEATQAQKNYQQTTENNSGKKGNGSQDEKREDSTNDPLTKKEETPADQNKTSTKQNLNLGRSDNIGTNVCKHFGKQKESERNDMQKVYERESIEQIAQDFIADTTDDKETKKQEEILVNAYTDPEKTLKGLDDAFAVKISEEASTNKTHFQLNSSASQRIKIHDTIITNKPEKVGEEEKQEEILVNAYTDPEKTLKDLDDAFAVKILEEASTNKPHFQLNSSANQRIKIHDTIITNKPEKVSEEDKHVLHDLKIDKHENKATSHARQHSSHLVENDKLHGNEMTIMHKVAICNTQSSLQQAKNDDLTQSQGNEMLPITEQTQKQSSSQQKENYGSEMPFTQEAKSQGSKLKDIPNATSDEDKEEDEDFLTYLSMYDEKDIVIQLTGHQSSSLNKGEEVVQSHLTSNTEDKRHYLKHHLQIEEYQFPAEKDIDKLSSSVLQQMKSYPYTMPFIDRKNKIIKLMGPPKEVNEMMVLIKLDLLEI